MPEGADWAKAVIGTRAIAKTSSAVRRRVCSRIIRPTYQEELGEATEPPAV
jgi:hypothetical protein